MTEAGARIMFALTAFLLAGTLGFLYLSSRPDLDSRRVVAQFENAFPLVEGMNVRVDGAIAGSVGPISVNDDGIAEVALLLDSDVPDARADATAAIRQQDTTGDSYVAFDPGKADGELREVDGHPTMACASEPREQRCPQTLVAPRLDDLLNIFGESERAGVQLLLAELASAVEARGKDLNRAAIDLRPALEATNRALADVNRQNAALRSLIADAEDVTGQAAGRREQLGEAIEGLAGTLSVTAEETAALDDGLERLPATAARARTTLRALTDTAIAARPLANALGDVATPLASVTGKAPGFVGDVRAFTRRTRPTLDLTHRLVKAATPAVVAQPERLVTGPFDLAPAISNLLRGVLGENQTIEALFNEEFGLGAAANEPGNQAGYPADFEDRHFLRVSAILNCEGFGVPIRPGCLLDLVTGQRRSARQSRAPRADRPRRERPAAPASPSPSGESPAPDPTAAPTVAAGVPRPELPRVPDVLKPLRDLEKLPPVRLDKPQETVDDLLDFLLK